MLTITIPKPNNPEVYLRWLPWVVFWILTIISAYYYVHFLYNGLGLAYNDARSHLDIGRRVVEGLKPGIAQLGSVWLPLPHILMIPTVWSDFMWHSGLAGALQSMTSFVATGLLIYKFLEKLRAGIWGRLIGVAVFTANLNVLYLQSTAMTELLLLATMTGGGYFLLLWHQDGKLTNLIKSAFLVMLSTAIRYDGWFLFLTASALVAFQTLRKKGYRTSEGTTLMYMTLGGVGILLWFLWNKLIFNDWLYFLVGPYSAYSQQTQLESAGNLATKGNLWLSIKIYFYAFMYNSYTLAAIMAFFGTIALWLDKKISVSTKVATLALLAPLAFNIIALYMGHSVLFIQGLSGNTWFNVRYGVMLLPSIAIFTGFLVDRLASVRWVIVGLLAFVTFFAFSNQDAVTIDDATVGSSQKNVSEVSGWLDSHVKKEKGFVLISAASHDAIIFSSGLPMKRFIHEGTGLYWDKATENPEQWARWIIMRTYDKSDLTYRLVGDKPELENYVLVGKYPFSDIYELKPEYLPQLTTEAILGKQK